MRKKSAEAIPSCASGSAAQSYAIEVEGEGTPIISGGLSGSIPSDQGKLIKKPTKDSLALYFLIVKTQVEMLCQAGRTDEAMAAMKKYQEEQEKSATEYNCPLNVFRRDYQDSGAPYAGAHCLYAAFRDTMGQMFDIYYKKKGDTKPSDKHLRKYVQIWPNHIFFMRDGKKILTPDIAEDPQQPTEDVPGFSRYEVILPPFNFRFTMGVRPYGQFRDILSQKERVLEAVYNMSYAGLCGRRSANFGQWRVKLARLVEWDIRAIPN